MSLFPNNSGEHVSGKRPALDTLGEEEGDWDSFDPQSGQSFVDYMSQQLEIRKKRKLLEDYRGSDSDVDSEYSSNLDSDGESDSNSDISTLDDKASATAGIIDKIILKNFMCHEYFELVLGPQLNFIVGRNGSGKSAILTGISVGLGAKASETSRGSSIKDLIKEGKEMARVIISFMNEGPEAYKPEEYGSRIIIERIIKRHGANAYLIKSENGRTLSTKRATLDEILFKYNIAVNNPLAFLSQDKAREFLTQSTDNTKFKFFMDGTLITDISKNLETTLSNTSVIKSKLEQARKYQKVAEHRYKASTVLYNKLRRSDSLRKRLEIVHGKAYWFNVVTIERKIEGYELALEKANNELCTIDSSFEMNNSKSTEARRSLEILSHSLNSVVQDVDKGKLHYEEIKEKRNMMKAWKADVQNDLSSRERGILEIEGLIKEKENEISHEQEILDSRTGSSKRSISDSIMVLQKNLETLTEEKEEIRHQVGRIEEKQNMNYNSSSRDASASEELIKNLKNKRMQLQNSKKDKYMPWGSNMNTVINAIKSIQNWHREPIGPLGAYIEVKQEFGQWKDLINTLLNKSLDSFLVCDEHDRRLLDQLFTRMKISKNIITRKFEEVEFSKGMPYGKTSLVDMLLISDKNVLYTLVDINNIEKNIITHDRDNFSQLVREPNVLSVFATLSSKSGSRASGGDNGSLRVDPIHYRDDLHRLGGSSYSESYLKEIEERIDLETDKLISVQRDMRNAKLESQKERQILEHRGFQIQKEIKSLNEEIIVKEDRLSENGDLSKIEVLKSSIAELKLQVTNNRNINSSLRDDLASEREKASKIKEDLEKARVSVVNKIREMENTKSRIESLNGEIAVLNDEKIHLEVNKDKTLESIEMFTKKIELGKNRLVSVLEEAESKCTREDANIDLQVNTSDSISREYEDLQRQVKDVEKSLGRSYEDIQQELLENKQKRDNANKHTDHLDNLFQTLESELRMRFQYLITTISKNENEASTSFERSLALRGFDGELRFNHQEKALTLLVQTRNDKSRRTVDSLSGGEKSFAQISLLLAIWRVMGTRIRGLDEFDVYMDSVNRSISIKLLLSELRQYPKSQTIFMTPQDIAVIGDLDSEDVKIHKMGDPRKEG